MTPNDHGSKASYTVTDWLRITCILTFIPAIVLNIVHGVLFQSPFPAVGLIPHLFSVALAIHELGVCKFSYIGLSRHYQILLEDEPPKCSIVRTGFIAFLDILIAVGLICFVGITFGISGSWMPPAGLIIETFATIPFLVNA
jgi:hypothetical protein